MSSIGQSGQYWPAHPHPRPNELFSSWLMRIIIAHHTTPHAFCSSQWPDKQIWTRDIDRSVDDEIIQVLASHTGHDATFVKDLRLKAFEGSIFPKLKENGHVNWLLNIGVYHRVRRRYGLLYCPACLATDETPYFRKHWRLAFYTVCPIHHVPLQDSCPQCGAPVIFHRVPKDQTRLSICHACGYSLESNQLLDGDPKPWRLQAEKLQDQILSAANTGWGKIPENQPVHVVPYLAGIRHISRLFISRPKSTAIYKALANTGQCELPTIPPMPTDHVLELSRIKSRQAAMAGTQCLLQDWPNNFIRCCKDAGVRYSDLIRTRATLPYWLWRAVRDHLYSASRISMRNSPNGISNDKYSAPQNMRRIPKIPGLDKNEAHIFESIFVSWYRSRRLAGIKARTINRDLGGVYGFFSLTKKPAWCCCSDDVSNWLIEIGQHRKLTPTTQRTYSRALLHFFKYISSSRSIYRRIRPLGFQIKQIIRSEHLIPFRPEPISEPIPAMQIALPSEFLTDEEKTQTHTDKPVCDKKPHTQCDYCNKSMVRAHALYAGTAYCSTCYAREFVQVACEKCGKTMRTPNGCLPAVCKHCKTLDRYCVRCGKPVPRAGLTLDIGVACPSCTKHFKPPKTCPLCGKLSKYLSRDYKKGFDEPVCPSCRNHDHRTCSNCGKYRPVAELDSNGKALCEKCVNRKSMAFICPICGEEGRQHSASRCEACYWDDSFNRRFSDGLDKLSVGWVQKGWKSYAQSLKAKNGSNVASLRLKQHFELFNNIDHSCSKTSSHLSLEELFCKLGKNGISKYRSSWRYLSNEGLVPGIESPEVRIFRERYVRKDILDEVSDNWFHRLLVDYLEHLEQENLDWANRGWGKSHRYSPRTLTGYLRAALRYMQYSGKETEVKSLNIAINSGLQPFLENYPGYKNSIQPFIQYIKSQSG